MANIILKRTEQDLHVPQTSHLQVNSHDYVILNKAEKYFGSGSTLVKAVDDMSFSLPKGSLSIIVGPSGAGKTTLLNLLGGMDYLSGGNIIVDGQSLYGLKKNELTMYRREKVGFVFQFYNLMPNLTALENVELATEICPRALKPEDVLQEVGLSKRLDYFPGQLSGGEQQRVSIARAMAKNPSMLLCDEPTGALDYKTGKLILALLQKFAKEMHKTVLIVTHNGALTSMGDYVIRVKNGQVEQSYKNPHPKAVESIEW
jgi:putative ABC transport system ATP-binding protein